MSKQALVNGRNAFEEGATRYLGIIGTAVGERINDVEDKIVAQLSGLKSLDMPAVKELVEQLVTILDDDKNAAGIQYLKNVGERFALFERRFGDIELSIRTINTVLSQAAADTVSAIDAESVRAKGRESELQEAIDLVAANLQAEQKARLAQCNELSERLASATQATVSNRSELDAHRALLEQELAGIVLARNALAQRVGALEANKASYEDVAQAFSAAAASLRPGAQAFVGNMDAALGGTRDGMSVTSSNIE